ncbi:MAG: hypothetical protein ACOVNU_02565 [Candidatus Kapaibacteriota bacterium]
MKTLLISLLLFMSVVGCDNLSPEQELDAKLQGKWRLVENFTGCFGSGKVDSNNLVLFKNSEILVTNGENSQIMKYQTTSKNNNACIIVENNFPSVVTDKFGNTKEVFTEDTFKCLFHNDGILEFQVLESINRDPFIFFKIKRIN